MEKFGKSQDLLTVIKEAAVAVKKHVDQLVVAGKTEFTNEEAREFLKPYFEKQDQIKDIGVFGEAVVAHIKYGFIGVGMSKPGQPAVIKIDSKKNS